MSKKRLNLLISSGPTREPIDPVRFLSNYSTGFLGILLAKLAKERGHHVTLAHGPMEVPKSLKVHKIPFETVLDLKRVLTDEVPKCDALIMIAAVSDFKPLSVETMKIKKGKRILTLTLVENPDVLKSLAKLKNGKFFIGFSVESKGVYKHSLQKLKKKGLDLIVGQKATDKKRPFGDVKMDIVVIDRKGSRRDFKGMSKEALAKYLIQCLEKRLIL